MLGACRGGWIEHRSKYTTNALLHVSYSIIFIVLTDRERGTYGGRPRVRYCPLGHGRVKYDTRENDIPICGTIQYMYTHISTVPLSLSSSSKDRPMSPAVTRIRHDE